MTLPWMHMVAECLKLRLRNTWEHAKLENSLALVRRRVGLDWTGTDVNSANGRGKWKGIIRRTS